MYIIKNAKLLLPDRVAEAHHVWIKDDRIEKITSGQTPLSDYYTIIDGQEAIYHLALLTFIRITLNM